MGDEGIKSDVALRQEVLKRAGGRCECRGECGDNHAWELTTKPRRCSAPHGCMVMRKRDHRSCWAPYFGGVELDYIVKDGADPADYPRTPSNPRGHVFQRELAFAEDFDNRPEEIRLNVVALDGNKQNRALSNWRALCAYCTKGVRARRDSADRDRRRRGRVGRL